MYAELATSKGPYSLAPALVRPRLGRPKVVKIMDDGEALATCSAQKCVAPTVQQLAQLHGRPDEYNAECIPANS